MRDPFPDHPRPPLRPGPLLVVGLGSPFGDDRVGWRVAEALRPRLPPRRALVLTLGAPGPELIAALAGRAQAILVDGAHTGAEPGTLHRLERADLGLPRAAGSSHALGLAETLALARALGALPRRVELLLISLRPDAATLPDVPLSPPVEAAALALVDELSGRLAARRRGTPHRIAASQA